MCQLVRKKLADMKEQHARVAAEAEAVRRARIDFTIMSRCAVAHARSLHAVIAMQASTSVTDSFSLSLKRARSRVPLGAVIRR